MLHIFLQTQSVKTCTLKTSPISQFNQVSFQIRFNQSQKKTVFLYIRTSCSKFIPLSPPPSFLSLLLPLPCSCYLILLPQLLCSHKIYFLRPLTLLHPVPLSPNFLSAYIFPSLSPCLSNHGSGLEPASSSLSSYATAPPC